MIYQFDNFEIDPDRFELRKDDTVIPLEPQVFALIVFLIEHRDRLVSKEELFEKLWDGRVVTDATLTSRIKSARQALGDSGNTQTLIRTVYGKGFRFIGDATLVHDARIESLESQPLDNEAQQRPSIAVLPFRQLGGAGEFNAFGAGLAHELIVDLARLRWLMVIARGSSFRLRDANVDMLEVGRLLGVRYCLSGDVEVSQQTLKVTVELVDTRNGEYVWGERYSGSVDDVHVMRSNIRSSVLTALDIRIPLHEATEARLLPSDSLDAWGAYHLGLQHLYRFNRNDNAMAAELFEHAIQRDRNFARAHAGLSFVHFQTAFMRQTDDIAGEIALARSNASRGLEIDPLDPFANFTMGRSFWLESDLASAREWLDRAVSLSPNYAQGLYALAWTNTIAGAEQDGREQIDTAMRLSPIDPLYYAMLGARGFTHLAREEYVEALAWTERAARAPGAHVYMAVLAAASQALAGDHSKARRWAKNVRERGPHIRCDDFFRCYPVKAEPMRGKISTALKQLGF